MNIYKIKSLNLTIINKIHKKNQSIYDIQIL